MFNFRRLPLFDEDQTKDTGEIKNFLNSYEGIRFCSFNKFMNVFLDKLLFIDPLNLIVTTISTNTFIVDFCFNDKINNIIILGKNKNALICSIYSIKEYNFILLKKIYLSKNCKNIKKTLISSSLDYIITLENNKITFYFISNDHSINKSELIEDEEIIENVFLCKDDNLVILKKNCANIYKLIKKNLCIGYKFSESINLNFYNNNDLSLNESILSIYNEEINILYICYNYLKVLCALNLNNRKYECILLDNKITDLFCVKFYLILLTELNQKFYINIYIIYEDMKLIVFNTSFNYLITNIIFFNNLLFFTIDDGIHKSEIKIDKYYFYEQLKNNCTSKEDDEVFRHNKSDSLSDIFIESEKTKKENFDLLKIYNENINKGSIRNNTNVNRKGVINEENNVEEKKVYADKFFKLNNKFFKNPKNKIKIVLKEKNINEIINIFKKKKLFHWLIKYSELNKNYHVTNFGYVYKIYADFLFEKEQYEKSMYQYIKTIGFLETSYVIHKYLNLDLYEYLSVYLEKLHETHLFNDEHTMMLLSCYKKECKKKKMIYFIKNNKNKINLNKTYKFLLNSGYYNVVLKFSKKNKDHLTYISILIDKFENYEKSLKYIFKLDVENICILLFRYGYKFIKYFPELTIYLLKKIIKKYNLNLTIFIPLFLDNIDFLFIFILKFLDKKKDEIMLDTNNDVDKSSLYDKKKVKKSHFINNISDKENSINIINRKKLEFDIFNGDYDYILFVTVMQILLQKYKKNEENTILTFNIDKLIKNKDKNIKFLSLLLLSIYNYNKGLLNICKKINKYDISFLFSINKVINKIKIKCNRKVLLTKNININDYQLEDKDSYKLMNKQFHTHIFKTCMEHFKLNYSFYNYIFYYLSLLNDDKFLIKFIKIINKKSALLLLNLILILQKYNKSYICIKKMLISYLNEINQDINSKYIEILKDKKELYKIKKQKLRNKYNFHLIENTYCSVCKEVLSTPIIHFLCNHSYHYYCLNNDKVCLLCYNKDNEKRLLKEKAKNAINNFDEFFKYLQGSTNKYSFISNYLSYGVIPNK
ncbi:vacuolar protein sorting-associated protein 11, putative [Plasmodium relictum]|uniref:Vacuolar protein sorting-associated protein 11, putative n=1 Tax=Plasmodium relictum TaxID=85471 RepID=A0A1J1H6V5_PLARL|nr:vacuolar protein sorting-associated protein 11, putative [Plasmodium relictum]CRH00649.1 vacuolar protein sorting-associated protein 11, putative [Plasmodium relictum]